MFPSELGKLMPPVIKLPLMLTYPDPLALNSILSFDLFAVITLSVIVTPSAVIEGVVIEMVVNVPAAGVVPPITTLSIAPPPMSTSSPSGGASDPPSDHFSSIGTSSASFLGFLHLFEVLRAIVALPVPSLLPKRLKRHH